MKPFQLGFSDPVTAVMRDLISLYNLIFTVGVLVLTIVGVQLLSLFFNNGLSARNITDAPWLEII